MVCAVGARGGCAAAHAAASAAALRAAAGVALAAVDKLPQAAAALGARIEPTLEHLRLGLQGRLQSLARGGGSHGRAHSSRAPARTRRGVWTGARVCAQSDLTSAFLDMCFVTTEDLYTNNGLRLARVHTHLFI